MNGKTVLVTGGDSGIGFETAAGLARMGAEVVITSRDSAKGASAVEEVKRRDPGATVTAMLLDLARLDDVRRFLHEFDGRFPRLDVLVNNAGVVVSQRQVTSDGFDTMFQVNHLGPFLLTHLLLNKLKASAPSRIVIVASAAHRGGRLHLDDLQNERGRSAMRAYFTTKFCNVLFARDLARRLEGSGVTAYALHPGTVRTGLGQDGDTKFFGLGARIMGPLFPRPARGARTPIHLASATGIEKHSGAYFQRSKVSRTSAGARDDQAARMLWDKRVGLLGIQ